MGDSSNHSSGVYCKLAQSLQQRLHYSFGPAQLALPNYEGPPAIFLQGLDCSLISIGVSQELGLPEFGARFGQYSESAPLMMMPKASMYKDTDPQTRDYNVGLSRQVLAMQSVAIAVGIQKPTHKHFRLCVLSLDAGHHSGSSGGINNVHFEQFR